MADRRVVITGLGVVCPAGVGIAPLWQAMMDNRSAIRPISFFDAAEFPCRAGGEIADFSARSFVPKDYRKAVKVMARDIEIAVAAADLAFRDSGVLTRGIDPGKVSVPSARLGCNIGAGLICTDLNELGMAVASSVKDGKFDMKVWGSQGLQNLTPLWLLKYLPNMLSCHVTIIHGCEGPSNTITCGDASGIQSASEATRQIQRGAADVAIAGGAESKLNPMGLLRQDKLGRLCRTGNDSPATAVRPFDQGHSGTMVGEGGGLVILEELEHAKARGAKIYAEVAGIGAGCDPAGIEVTSPTVGSLDLAVRAALRNAGIAGEEVDAIVAHGTAVPGEDRLEAAAWRVALGERAATVPATAFGGVTGSLFAGAGGVSLALGATMVREQVVPPTVNHATPDIGCELNFAQAARPAKLNYVACGGFATGGQSAAMVLRKYSE